MDRETLNAHAAVWGVEDKPSRADLSRLTSDERALYDDLRDNRIGCRLICIEAEQYIPACRCCLQGGGCANASAASGDEHNFVFHGAPW